MKRFFYIFVILTLVFSGSIGFAADKYATAPVIKNHLAGSTVTITFPANTDSTGSQHSYAMFIGNVNKTDAYVWAKTATASDINIIYHFSNDLTNWVDVTATKFDALSNTAVVDTLGAAVVDEFHDYNWLVVESDGQTAATSDDILYWQAAFKADVLFPGPNGQPLKHMFYTAENITDP